MKHLAILILLISCSSVSTKVATEQHSARPPQIGVTDERKPNFYIHPNIPKQGRAIASHSDDSLSNKQLYFLSLYQQVKQLETLIGSKQSEGTCPAFHHELVSYKDALSLKDKDLSLNHDYKQILSNDRLLPSAPVMGLPYAGTDVYTYLKANPRQGPKQVVKEALTDYLQHLKAEVATLCDTGASDDYYVYENFVTYANTDAELVTDQDKLSAALKIPVFANLLILEGLKHQHLLMEQTQVVEEAMNRASVTWLKNYLYELGKLRQHESQMSLLDRK